VWAPLTTVLTDVVRLKRSGLNSDTVGFGERFEIFIQTGIGDPRSGRSWRKAARSEATQEHGEKDKSEERTFKKVRARMCIPRALDKGAKSLSAD